MLVAGFNLGTPLVPNARRFFVAPADQTTLYMGFINDQNRIKLVNKVSCVQDDTSSNFINFINDGLSEFVIFCEKD